MLLKTIQLIRKHVVGELSPIEILVDSRPTYNTKYIVSVSIDPLQKELDDLLIQLEEYDDEKKYLYLRGTVGAGSNSHSPTSNFSLTKLKDFDFNSTKGDVSSWSYNDWLEFVKSDDGTKFYETALKKSDKKKVSPLNKKMDVLKKRDTKSSEELGSNADLTEIINEISAEPNTIIDLNYHITDNKQYPPTKEIIAACQISDSSISKITNTISELERGGDLFEFYKINDIVDYKLFLSILDSFYQNTRIKKGEFYKQNNERIYKSYQRFLLKQDLQISSTERLKPYYPLLNNFKVTHKFLELNNILN
ncbi:MAG: hypothetical protein OEY49_16245 [Candidatus Heimdallarchaeota archaeon]|nr:hypothetical protein [Candidatus Heimdallarchaeota archaeon]